MTTYLITGVNRGIGAALAAGATARGYSVIGTTRGGEGTVPMTLDDPAQIAAQLVDIPPLMCSSTMRASKGRIPIRKCC